MNIEIHHPKLKVSHPKLQDMESNVTLLADKKKFNHPVDTLVHIYLKTLHP